MKGGFLVLIEGENDNPFSDLSVNVGVERGYRPAGDVAHLLAELVPALSDEILTEPFHHLDSILGLGELAFRRGQDAFEANENNVADDEGPHIVRAAAHEFLLELDDSVANRAFHFAFTPTFFHEPYITHGDTQKTYQVWA